MPSSESSDWAGWAREDILAFERELKASEGLASEGASAGSLPLDASRQIGGSEGVPDARAILSRYELQGRLGEGATAVVYRAWDRELKRPVAVKVLREHAALSEIARQRFRREATTAAGLAHPHVVQVFDAGEAQGKLYIVMELVDGQPFSEILKKRGSTETELTRILEQAARGLGAAHEKGVVHRDLKPANILVGGDGLPKVGDFGLAHLAESKTELTRTGTTLGTPLYMSPEQVEGRPKEISTRTDVYALGAILYEILTARTPHQGETLAEIYGKIVREEPIAPRKLKAEVSKDLETIALKALEKDPRKRYPSAREFAEDLRRALEGEPIEARRISGAERLWRKAAKRRAILLPLFGAILLGLGVGIFVPRKAVVPPKLIFLERAEGDVRMLFQDGKKTPAHQGQIVSEGQGIETGAKPSGAVLRFEDGSLELGPESSLVGVATDGGKRVRVLKGWLRADTGKQPMSLDTPLGTIEGAGAKLLVIADPDPRKGTRLVVEEGSVRFVGKAGKDLRVEQGQALLAREGGEPVVERWRGIALGPYLEALPPASRSVTGDADWAFAQGIASQRKVPMRDESGNTESVFRFPYPESNSITFTARIVIDGVIPDRRPGYGAWGFGLAAGFSKSEIILRSLQNNASAGESCLQVQGPGSTVIPFVHDRTGTYELKLDIERRNLRTVVVRGKLWQGPVEPDRWSIETEGAVEGPIVRLGLQTCRCSCRFEDLRLKTAP